ncbi:MAG: transposase [Kiritimatiellae bacterium]|nr:transposase [Kiritimatiellia bacterium]
MRTARLKGEGGGCYHCLSRVIDRRMALDEVEKERFRAIMRQVETFSGVRILTYAILDNHFHLLVQVPPRAELSEAELKRRIGTLYGRFHVRELEQRLATWREQDREDLVEREKARYTYRMYEISEFMSRAELLRCRVRYFTDRVVLGSREFVNAVDRRNRAQFGRKREDGARAMRGGDWGALCTMRELRLEVISVTR